MAVQHYIDEQAKAVSSAPARLRELHAHGLKALGNTGFPTTKIEAWRFTNVEKLVNTPFKHVAEQSIGDLSVFEAMLPPHFEDPRLVFVNGWVVPALSQTSKLPKGVIVCTLAEAAEQGLLENSLTSRVDNGFTALNTAFLRHGAFVYVPEGVSVSETVHLVYLSLPVAEGDAFAVHLRNIISVGNRARLNLVEAFIGEDADGSYFNNVVTEVVTGANSTLRHYKVQNESLGAYHIAHTHAALGRDSHYSSQSVSFGATLSRNDLVVRMNYEGADCQLNGLYVTQDNQHVDNHTTIDHAVPHCTSRELYKGILSGASRAVFDGRIIVRPNAQKTDASQNNRNLLLGDKATVDSKPQLEIFADDVKCAHGTAIGKLDEDSVYYLRSRGLSRDDALGLMTHAFAGEVIDTMKLHCTRTWVDELLWRRIPDGARLRPEELDARICMPALAGT